MNIIVRVLAFALKILSNQTRKRVLADKGYKSKANDMFLKSKGSKNGVMHKAYRVKPLSSWQKKLIKLLAKRIGS